MTFPFQCIIQTPHWPQASQVPHESYLETYKSCYGSWANNFFRKVGNQLFFFVTWFPHIFMDKNLGLIMDFSTCYKDFHGKFHNADVPKIDHLYILTHHWLAFWKPYHTELDSMYVYVYAYVYMYIYIVGKLTKHAFLLWNVSYQTSTNIRILHVFLFF